MWEADVVNGMMYTPENLRLGGIQLQSVGAHAVGYSGKTIRHATLQTARVARLTEPIYLGVIGVSMRL